jgi:hypothetical protein
VTTMLQRLPPLAPHLQSTTFCALSCLRFSIHMMWP